MRQRTLVLRSLAHHRRTNAAVVLGVAVAVAVLAGALLVGHSVRTSLRTFAEQRIGRTDTALAGTRLYDEGWPSGSPPRPEPLRRCCRCAGS